ncbi:STAS domain-containing protein [Sphingomonas mucosissima]|uniref:Anti-sigma factor antagonist n=1 Tax=Sphingomonas mucosissima TaxID=370959 RepID=A0A245ZJM6_9SPHN|nr:STAS domain-containing protein [Sphingomonas mucosissima]OWK29941.1 anti-sigma-B factor antagonist [Sphingomonas mucosissima]
MTASGPDDDIALIDVDVDRLDAAAAPALKARLQARLDGSARKILLNLERVSFMDSTGLGVLVSLIKMLGKDGAIAVTGVQPPVRRLFELTRLDTVFRMASGIEEGKAALRG